MNLSSYARVAEAGFVNFPGPCMVGHHHRSMENRMPPDFFSLASNPRPSVSSSFNPFNVPYGYHDSSHSSSAGPVTGASMGTAGPVIGAPGNGMPPGIHDLLYRTLPYGFSPLSFASPGCSCCCRCCISSVRSGSGCCEKPEIKLRTAEARAGIAARRCSRTISLVIRRQFNAFKTFSEYFVRHRQDTDLFKLSLKHDKLV